MPDELDDFLRKQDALQYKTQVKTLVPTYDMETALDMLREKDSFLDYLRTVDSSDQGDFPIIWKMVKGMTGQVYWKLWVEWLYKGGEFFSDEDRKLCKDMQEQWLTSPRNLSVEEFFVSLFVTKVLSKMA